MERTEEYIRIGPKDFIRGPYIVCPKCGKNAFGVLMILKDHYYRRCKECFYPRGGERAASFALPELNKKVIYLDQFATSNMMLALNPEAKSGSQEKLDRFWLVLFEKLDFLCKLQLIVCPDSDFHRHESMLSAFYAPLERMYELLSGGVSFQGHETIHRFQVMDQLHKWLGDRNNKETSLNDVVDGGINAWQERFIISVRSAEIPGLVEEIRSVRGKVEAGLIPVFKRWQSERGKDFNYWYEKERKAHASTMLNRYKRSLANFASASCGAGSLELEDLMNFAVVTVHEIKSTLKERGMKDDAVLKKLNEFLRSAEFENAPYVRISAILWAAVARKAASGRRKPPNKGFATDVEIISTLLPYCDGMFIDNECRGHLVEKPLRDEIQYPTKVFSYKTKESFLEYLDQIKSSASLEHMEKVREVYGEDWEKPFTELYRT